MNIKEMKEQIKLNTQKLNMLGTQGFANMQIVLGVANCLDYIYSELANFENEQDKENVK